MGRNTSITEMVVAEFGRYPSQMHLRHQVLDFCDRAVNMLHSCLVKLALFDVVHTQQPCGGFTEDVLEIICHSSLCCTATTSKVVADVVRCQKEVT